MELQSSDPFAAEVKQLAAEKTAGGPNQDSPPLPELRLVLLGRKGTGKSSSGNTVLGNAAGFESGKPTEECVKRRADTASYRVTVVDTPGWEWYYSGNGTPAWVTRETMRSVTVCSPGPHALLLVIRSSASVTEDYYRQVEEHLELLGRTAWAHTLLLFTRGDELGSVPIEQRIRSAGRSFQALFARCGNRFHVLENKRCGKDGAQVKELLRKIEAMVEERGGRHYEGDPLLLGIEVEGRRRARERRKKQRIMEAQAQKGIVKAVLTTEIPVPDVLDETSPFSRGSRRLPELRLILVGERETGKSSAGNTILKAPTFFQTGQATEECTRRQAEISGRMVTVVDVPGWEGGPEGITPDRIKREICSSVSLCPPGPHALLLTLRVDALVRASAVREHLELLGEGAWRHTILLFTRGDQLREGVTIEQHIQGGGRDLHWLMDKCGQRYHVISSAVWESARSEAQVTALLEKIEKTASRNRCEAFSPVVQEIQELGRQKNERFNVKLKEVNEKFQRQELELKRMREREVKSIRWIFDWRKDKGKSADKRSRGKEEGTDRNEEDRKSIMSELEERMVWLTEDREREIQELSLENSSLIAALNQGVREREEMRMKLDEKEQESEELKEKVDELQVNVLELKRVRILEERERKAKEELIRRHGDAENELDREKKEGEELRRRVEEMQKTLEESQLKYQEELCSGRQEQERRGAEGRELERRLKEKEKEMEALKLEAESKVREQTERLKEVNEKRETEKMKLGEMIELMRKEMEELQVAYRKEAKTSEAVRRIHEELADQLAAKDAELAEVRRRQKEQETSEDAEIQKKLGEKDAEISGLAKKLIGKEREIETLRQTADAANRAVETARIKDLENEYKEMEEFLKRENVFMKEEMEGIKQLNEEKEEDTRKILEVKENVINHLRQQAEERGARVEELTGQLMEVQMKAERLQTQNAALAREVDGLRTKCEDHESDLRLQIEKNKSREKDLHDILIQSEEMGRIKDALNQENAEKKEREICSLEQRNRTQRMELDCMKDQIGELEKRIEEMKKYHQERLSERVSEMGVKEAEREQRLRGRELELDNQEQEVERAKRALEKRDDELKGREQELEDKKQQLDRREDEMREKENELSYQSKNNQERRENLEKREQELTEGEKGLENKRKEVMELSEKQDLEKENTEKELEEKTNLLGKIEEELGVEKSELECQRENLDIREKELSKREQDSAEDLVKIQELRQAEQEVGKQQAELNAREGILRQRSSEYQKKEQDLLQLEHDLQIRNQKLLETTKEIEERGEELLKKQEVQTAAHDRTKKELETIKDMLELRERKLRDTMDVLDNRERECKNREKDLDNKEKQIAKKLEELEESKQKSQEVTEELVATQEELLVKQIDLQKEKKDFEDRREKLEKAERGWKKREQELTDLWQLYDLKAQEVSKGAQEVEKSKREYETRQTELSDKELELLRGMKELREKEQELQTRENNLQLKSQELLGKNVEGEMSQQQLLDQQNQMNENWEGQLDEFGETLAKREQELTKKENELRNKEENIRSAEIYLEKRETVVKKREREVQRTKEQNDHIFSDLEKKQGIVEEMKRSSERKRHELGDLEQELGIREKDVTDKEQELNKRNKDLDVKERNMEKQERELKLRDQAFGKAELELNVALESKKRHLENLEAELENQRRETNVEKQLLKMKSEQLEKWGRYLYNMELKMINSDPGSDFQPWDQNRAPARSGNSPGMYQEVGRIYDRVNESSSGGEDKQVVELESEELAWLVRSRGLEMDTEADGDGENRPETVVLDKEDDVEEFFEPDSSNGQMSPGLFYQISELKLMLLGDAWSSRQSATRTILGQGAKVGSPWRGKISGQSLLLVEPRGIKWRSSGATNVSGTSRNDLMHSVSLCAPGPHAFVLILPAYLSFTRQYRKAVECTMATLGEAAWRHAVVLFTWAEALGESGQQHVKRNGDLEWLVQKCEGRYTVLDNRHREAHAVDLVEMVHQMVAANRGRFYQTQ